MVCWSCEDEENHIQQLPGISNLSITNITPFTANCTFSVVPVGATQLAGVIFGIDESLLSDTSKISTTEIADGNISLTLSSLKAETWYYYKAFISDIKNVLIYSRTGIFRTQPLTFNTSVSLIEASYMAEQHSFTINSNVEWTIVSDQNWCTVQPLSGNGNRDITVSVSENNTGTLRTATLTITAGNQSRQVTVEQGIENTTLNVSVSSINAPHISELLYFNIFSNAAWSISSNQDWCSVQPAYGTGNDNITINVTENTSGSPRTAILTITAGKLSRQVMVEQDYKGTNEFGNGITPSLSFGGGNGSQGSPYLIHNAMHLKKLVDDVNNWNSYEDTYFKLMTDIHVTANEWIPIGRIIRNNDISFSFAFFSGIFNGNGHAISGLLQSDKNEAFGFFGGLDGSAQISNLIIAATVRNEMNNMNRFYSSRTGAIAGMSFGTNNGNIIIDNCNVTGMIKGGISEFSCTGGIVGQGQGNFLTIQNCNVSGYIGDGGYARFSSITGGIVGSIGRGFITNCILLNSATVNGQATSETRIGGIAGEAGNWSETKIANCINNATITGSGDQSFTGGIVGYNVAEITNCTVSAYGNVTGHGNDAEVGGITGLNAIGKINDCTNDAVVSGTLFVGGIAGRNGGEIHTSLNTGNISGRSSYGGLVGYNQDSGIYSCCTNRGSVNGEAANTDNQIGGGIPIKPCPLGHTKR